MHYRMSNNLVGDIGDMCDHLEEQVNKRHPSWALERALLVVVEGSGADGALLFGPMHNS